MSTRKRKSRFKDPMAAREARQYEHPVPSREAVMEYLREVGEPVSARKLLKKLGIEAERDLEAMTRRLNAMERDGQILKNRRGRYGLASKLDMVCGTLTGHPDGFGFLVPDDSTQGDLFISPREMRKALHGDRVMGRVTGVDKRGRLEGGIVEVLEHRHHHIVGRLVSESGVNFVLPDDKRISHDILIPPGEEGDARSGQIVNVEILHQPTARSQPIGRIIEVLGDHLAPGMEIELAIRKYELPYKWPSRVSDESLHFGAEVAEPAKKGRYDLRDLPLVTIDGLDARDFDDAVYCEKEGRGWRLYVAIADVSHYVKVDSALDREAYQRGNSVYFPNRVIPMLPEVLSNGLCSLNPEVDRLCMVCEMEISAGGRIQNYEFYEAVMRSHARLIYEDVAAMLQEGDVVLRQKYQAVLPHLENLHGLYRALLQKREKRGAIDFELPETQIIYQKTGRIDKIVPRSRNVAHRIIEECMLAANVCAAEFFHEHEIPAPYRIHAGPTEEKLTALREFLFEMGLQLPGGDEPEARDFSRVLAGLEGKVESRLIQTVMLRSMSQAQYSPDNIGHFGLSYKRYAHFTSPIRRYPDLIVHRLLKEVLAVTGNRKRFRLKQGELAKRKEQMAQYAEHCSMTGRRADEATWDVIKWLKTEFMSDRVGESFDGIISGVTSFGLFVELEDVFVEGLVHVTSLGNDYYHFDPVKHRLTGERTATQYRLGDKVTVKVTRVDLDEARIDFEMAALAEAVAKTPARRKSRKKTGRGKRKGRTGRR